MCTATPTLFHQTQENVGGDSHHVTYLRCMSRGHSKPLWPQRRAQVESRGAILGPPRLLLASTTLYLIGAVPLADKYHNLANTKVPPSW